MFFIICIIILIVAIFLSWWFDYNDHNLASLISAIIAAPVAITAIIMTIMLMIMYCDVPGTEAMWQERYSSLNTRIERHMYSEQDRNALIEEVQNWNEDFVTHEKSHNNFWVGIFHPGSTKGLSKIDLEKIE